MVDGQASLSATPAADDLEYDDDDLDFEGAVGLHDVEGMNLHRWQRDYQASHRAKMRKVSEQWLNRSNWLTDFVNQDVLADVGPWTELVFVKSTVAIPQAMPKKAQNRMALLQQKDATAFGDLCRGLDKMQDNWTEISEIWRHHVMVTMNAL